MSLTKVHEKRTQTLLGLRIIVDTIGLSLADLAQCVGVVKSYTSALASLKKGCSLDIACRIAAELCCSLDDLLHEPTAKRLAEIRVAHLRRQLDAAASDLSKMEAA